jgi:ABC-2 type transport system permease protein
MHKIFLIIQREYLSRIKKRSFIIMTVLGPILFALFMILPVWFSTMQDKDIKTIAVIDSTHIFEGQLAETQYIKFKYLSGKSIHAMKNSFATSGYYAVLFITPAVTASNSVVLFSDKQPSLPVVMHIQNVIEKLLEKEKLKNFKIENIDNILASIKTDVNIQTIKWNSEGESKENNAGLAGIVGYVGGFILYFFIFLFGSQVMRGVIEEKTNRIIEVIISSVKPFQLMMGKILGIALVGLTQFFLWVVLTLSIVKISQDVFFPELGLSPTQQAVGQDIMGKPAHNAQYTNPDSQIVKNSFEALSKINWGIMLGCFLFFFLFGYLLYATLFAAIGSVVDNETDTQQFMLPVTVPLILAMFVMINAIQNPDGSLAFWFSLIPFTSPIVMMVRVPFGVPAWQVYLSMGLLVATFIGMVGLTAKIYRTAILLYGKKAEYKEIWKWLRHQ